MITILIRRNYVIVMQIHSGMYYTLFFAYKKSVQDVSEQ